MSNLRTGYGRLRVDAAKRAAILRAAADGRARGPVRLIEQNGRQVMEYDAVHLASDTGNYWWNGLDSRTCSVALRLVHMSLRLGPKKGTDSPSAARVRRCAICGKGPCRLRMPCRAVYPHAPICDACAGPNRVMAQDAGDAWAEFHVYPIDAQLPLQRR